MQRSRNQVWREEKDRVDAVRKDKTKKLIEYLGGKCSRCGYNKCIAALDFHHINPETKSFNIAPSMSRSMFSLMREADKCILLCSNCHRELHYNERELMEIAKMRKRKDSQTSMF